MPLARARALPRVRTGTREAAAAEQKQGKAVLMQREDERLALNQARSLSYKYTWLLSSLLHVLDWELACISMGNKIILALCLVISSRAAVFIVFSNIWHKPSIYRVYCIYIHDRSITLS